MKTKIEQNAFYDGQTYMKLHNDIEIALKTYNYPITRVELDACCNRINKLYDRKNKLWKQYFEETDKDMMNSKSRRKKEWL